MRSHTSERTASLRLSSNKLWLAGLGALVLTACGGGNGDSVSLGSGQGPDPATVDFPIAYVKRSLPTPPMQFEDDAKVLRAFNVNADLFLRDRASPSVPERNITQRVTGDTELWDVKDVDGSYDGKLVIFAMRGPIDLNADEEDLPKWGIWEYNRDTDTLRRVIVSDIVASEGHDVSPHYLPDGRIVFTSTRQRTSRAVLLDESKPQFEALDEDRNEPAFVLHVMNADGTAIHQISFNQSHDRDPSVLPNGQIVFTRWDHAPGNDGMALYRANPDGTGLELYYGANSHAIAGTPAPPDVQFLQPRLQNDGRIMSIVRPFDGTDFGGDIVAIDTSNYVENTQPTLPNRGILSGPAQQRAVTNDVELIPGEPSPGGVFSAAFPLLDGTQRMFVSWAQCRLLEGTRIVPCTSDRLRDPNVVSAPPAYGIWIYDQARSTQLPVVAPEEGVMFTDVVTLQPRTPPPVILDKVAGVDLDATLVNENVGLVDIRSVYDIDGVSAVSIPTMADPLQTAAAQRPARFMRVEKAVAIPDDEVRDFRQSGFGVSNFMRDILGYAPIEPDGSIRIKVPANVPLAISVLDVNGRRIGSRHDNWLQVRPGEVLQCNGCHNPASTDPTTASHGRSNLFTAVNTGATTTGVPFPNTEPALFADAGETMAQTRARISCSTDNCAALNPSVNVVFDDVWTDPARRAKDPSFSYRYAGLTTTAPTSSECQTRWSSLCRITINYEQHIHPLWAIVRQMIDPVTGAVLQDNTCTSCHSPRDAANAVRLPASQLDLSDGASPDEADRFNSYQELLFTDNEQVVIMGALQDRLVPRIDPVTGQPVIDPVTGLPIMDPVPVTPSMTGDGANASNRFMSRFNAGGTHAGRLTPDELRLISEWLDVGAQYYNNPFDVPLN
jgi:hypothetical protein